MKINRLPHGRSTPRTTAWWLVALLVVLAALAAVLPISPAYVAQGDAVLVAAFGAYGLNLITGYGGQASIGNAGFMAIGGLTAFFVGTHLGGFVVGAVAAFVVGTVVGGLVGAIALRWRGFYLVLATLAVQFIVVFAMQKVQLADGSSYLAGFTMPAASVGGYTFLDDRYWFVLLAGLLALLVLLIAGLVDSRFGRSWMAIRENEAAADVCGTNVVWMKILVFGIGSGTIAFGGALAASYAGSISFESFTLEVSTSYIAMIIIGGLGSMAGPLLGAFVVTMIPYLITSGGNSGVGRALNGLNGGTGLPFLETILYCVVVLLFLVFEPLGLANLGPRLLRLLSRRQSSSIPPGSAAGARKTSPEGADAERKDPVPQ